MAAPVSPTVVSSNINYVKSLSKQVELWLRICVSGVLVSKVSKGLRGDERTGQIYILTVTERKECVCVFMSVFLPLCLFLSVSPSLFYRDPQFTPELPMCVCVYCVFLFVCSPCVYPFVYVCMCVSGCV